MLSNEIQLSKRQLRTLKELTLRGEISRYDLNRFGGLNSPETVRQLRKKGFVINMVKKSRIDQYGVKVHTGFYHLDDSQKDVARQIVASRNGKDGAK